MATPEIWMPGFTVTMLDTCRRYKKYAGKTLYEVMAHVNETGKCVEFPTQAVIAHLVLDCFGLDMDVSEPAKHWRHSFPLLIPAHSTQETRLVFLARIACRSRLVTYSSRSAYGL